MDNQIVLSTSVEKKRITYKYEICGPWVEAFNLDGPRGWFGRVNDGVKDFVIEYNEDIDDVPLSIAVIPFVCNVLPIAWVYDAKIIIPEIDEDFFQSISGFKRGYIGMYPDIQFGGELIAKKVVKNKLSCRSKRPLLFFSGGVDAHFTLLSILDEKPQIFTIWGSDIFFSQKKIWDAVHSQHKKISQSLGLDYSSAKSAFRFFLNYEVLDKKFARPNRASSWWHGFQHGIGLLSHAAPLVWKHGVENVYIASSYSFKDDQTTTCASWPTIDEFLRFSDCLITHHDFRYTRQDKIREICRISKDKSIDVYLRVCWQSMKDENCGKCEKCARTIYAILAEGYNPEDFGFRINDDAVSELEDRLLSGSLKPTKFWSEIVDRFYDNYEKYRKVRHVKIFLDSYEKSVENQALL